ncbi:MAG: DUF1343 domain-containing protein [Planctomycetes bacterium]|nr:DUF1343 domain-containing protein [Planctomycetota bacterium]
MFPRNSHLSAESNVGPSSGPVTIGLERCLADPPEVLRGAAFGLLSNQASVDAGFQLAHALLARRFPGRLKALFGPQHGFWSQQQDNMIETPHGRDRELDVSVHSLYADQRKPTPDMLAGLDCLVIDLQDAGTRVYTFVWTVVHCMQACAAAGVPVLVLDRPNPLGGIAVEGPRLSPGFESFVGLYSVPMRHGLTMAEMAVYLHRRMAIGVDLHVAKMDGWRRAMSWTDTGRVWVAPSPNLPRIEGVDVYPGQVLLEGTNLSEGRGTTLPFEVCGAPFIDSRRLLDALERFELPGVAFRPVQFEPTFQKWQGVNCGGVCLHVLDRRRFTPFRTTLALMACVKRLWPREFQWRQPPYEYEHVRMPIDILAGSDAVRQAIDGDAEPEEINALAAVPELAWWSDVTDCLLYA